MTKDKARDSRRYVVHLPKNIAIDIAHKRGTKVLRKCGDKDEYVIGYDKDLAYLAMVVGCNQSEFETFVNGDGLLAITFDNMIKVLKNHEWCQV